MRYKLQLNRRVLDGLLLVRGSSYQDLANHLRISRTTLYRYCEGQSILPYIVAKTISRYLDCPTEALTLIYHIPGSRFRGRSKAGQPKTGRPKAGRPKAGQPDTDQPVTGRRKPTGTCSADTKTRKGPGLTKSHCAETSTEPHT